jgi:hypothetical protein
LSRLSGLTFFRSSVTNISDRKFFRRRMPPGFLVQDRESPRLRLFRNYLPQIQPVTLQSAQRLRHWVRLQQPNGPSWQPHVPTLTERLKGDLDDPFWIIAAQRAGAWAVCRQFSYLMVAVAESAGMDARVVTVTSSFWKGAKYGHVMTEVWIPNLKKWVLMDAMWDVTYTVDGAPASALDVYDAVRLNGVYSVNEVGRHSCSSVDRIALQGEFRHLFIAMTNALFDGYGVRFFGKKTIWFAHLTTPQSPSYPSNAKSIAVLFGTSTCALATVILAWLVCFRSRNS